MSLCVDLSIKMWSLDILISLLRERQLFFPHKDPGLLLSGEKTEFLKFQDLTRRDMLTYMLRHKQLPETAVGKKIKSG